MALSDIPAAPSRKCRLVCVQVIISLTISSLTHPQHHFFFGEEPVSSDNFKSLIAKNKADATHAAAWSAETGKGLLYFVKDAAQKLAPTGVIPLSEADEVAPKGKSGFTFKTGATTHSFKAATPTDRDGWVSAFKEKIAEAKTMKEDVTGSDTYKENVEKWGMYFYSVFTVC
jgi:Pleckstrin homology domain